MEQHLTCLTSGDEMLINELFEKGASYRCVLAQLYSDKSMVKEGEAQGSACAKAQELYTEGYPDGRYRAMLVIEGANLATAVKGDCKACNNIAIRHLIVDGNRPALLRVKKGTALIELGNAENQIVQGCRLYDTRSWSTLHLREGDRMQCSGALIENNDIGPCGEEWDESYDGPSYGKPRWGQPWADGISLACKNSIVIHDATDGAIVIFGSSGSRVQNNTIYSRTLRVTGGINLVDHPPWEGDYTGVVVEDNVIEAIGAFVSVFLYNSGSPLPRRLRDGLDYLAFRASEDDRLLVRLEKRISNSLMLSQMRVMRQLDELTAQVERDLLDEEGRLIT
ncbi:hypothetical protein FRB97_007999, partial [Tulasnella sp. 331]